MTPGNGDNFLLRLLKGVPKSHVYRIVRGGEVRVNKSERMQPIAWLMAISYAMPPVRVAEKPDTSTAIAAAPHRCAGHLRGRCPDRA